MENRSSAWKRSRGWIRLAAGIFLASILLSCGTRSSSDASAALLALSGTSGDQEAPTTLRAQMPPPGTDPRGDWEPEEPPEPPAPPPPDIISAVRVMLEIWPKAQGTLTMEIVDAATGNVLGSRTLDAQWVYLTRSVITIPGRRNPCLEAPFVEDCSGWVEFDFSNQKIPYRKGQKLIWRLTTSHDNPPPTGGPGVEMSVYQPRPVAFSPPGRFDIDGRKWWDGPYHESSWGPPDWDVEFQTWARISGVSRIDQTLPFLHPVVEHYFIYRPQSCYEVRREFIVGYGH